MTRAKSASKSSGCMRMFWPVRSKVQSFSGIIKIKVTGKKQCATGPGIVTNVSFEKL